ncbi:MAG: hypothetical protein NWE93_07280 [Candidatus Bathyarchaeota archaeon]|nr:hypothetical protein [Candidatus Bathyarchaeota archaeon]
MSGKMKKTSENMSFSLSRWFRKLTQNAPAATIVTLVGISYAIFLFGGGLYDLINAGTIQPSGYSATTGQFFFLYPDISQQFVADTIVAITLYALGFVGMLAVYQSTKNFNKPRQAYMLLVIGVTFLLLSYIFLEGAVLFKTS